MQALTATSKSIGTDKNPWRYYPALHNQAPFFTFEWHAASGNLQTHAVDRLPSRDQVSVKRKEPAGIGRLVVLVEG